MCVVYSERASERSEDGFSSSSSLSLSLHLTTCFLFFWVFLGYLLNRQIHMR